MARDPESAQPPPSPRALATSGRLVAVDRIKAAAIVAVVFTHAGRGVDDWSHPLDFALTRLWVNFHVPSFLFVSGLLYAATRPIALREVGARLWRVLLPFAIASCLALWVYPLRPADWTEALERIATASALGIYYYVFLIVCCIPLLWPLSRLGRNAVTGVWIAYLLWTLAIALVPALYPPVAKFWRFRDPLRGFAAGYFLTGWLVALWLPEIVGLYARHRLRAWALVATAVALGLLTRGQVLSFPPDPFDRMLYTFGVVGLVAVASHGNGRPLGGTVRLLSEATLALYLYHRMFQLLARPITNGWPDLARVGAQVVVGLAGGLLVVLAGRRLLGRERARRLLGA